MKKLLLTLILSLLAVLVIVPANADSIARGKVVVANRASGSISVIDVPSGVRLETIELPAAANPPEPMYVTHSRRSGYVFVGDRANDRVVVYDESDFSVVTTIGTGSGIFHMWSDPFDRYLWVNNDIDHTATVIDPVNLSVIATVAMPADLVAQGYKPHDVILSPIGSRAYVTMLGGDNTVQDYVVQFRTRTFEEVNRVAVGKDPHVSLTGQNGLLYVPAQGSDVVHVFNRFSLESVTDISVPGAHGAGMALDGEVFYTTNLPGGGQNGLFAIDTSSNAVIGSSDTPHETPHNIAVTRNQRLFVTHSGASSDKVSIYDISLDASDPVLIGDVTVGLNPFGLVYVPGR